MSLSLTCIQLGLRPGCALSTGGVPISFIAYGGTGAGVGGTTLAGGTATEVDGSDGGTSSQVFEGFAIGGGGGAGAPGMTGAGNDGLDGVASANGGGAGGAGSGGAGGGTGQDGSAEATAGTAGSLTLTVEGGGGGGGGCNKITHSFGDDHGGDGAAPGAGGGCGAGSGVGNGGDGADGAVVCIYGYDAYTDYTAFTSGSGSWTIPEGANQVKVVAVGAGAGGGQGAYGTAEQGGGSGGYIEAEFAPTGGNVIYSIGTGGAGATSIGDGADGGDTSFTYCTGFLSARLLELPQADSTGLIDIIASDWEDTRDDVINIPTHDGVDDSGDQVISEIPAYVPCLENARVVRNLVGTVANTHSEDFTASGLIDYNTPVSVTYSTADKPEGLTGATTITSDDVFEGRKITSFLTPGVTYTCSVWAKGIDGSEEIMFTDGVGTGGALGVSTSWVRYSHTIVAANDAAAVIVATANDTVLFSGWQLENVSGLTIQTPSAYQSVGVVIDGTDELVTDGGMEESDTWIDYNTPSTNERSTEQVDAGTYSRKIIGSNTDGFRHVTSFNVVGGVNYFVTARVYVTSGNVRAKNWSGKLPSYDLQNSGTGAWETISGVFEATATGSEGIRFECYGGGATFYVDSVSIKKATTGFAYNVRENANTVDGSNIVTEAVGDLISPAPYWAHYPAATNKAGYSSEFDTANWTKGNCTATLNGLYFDIDSTDAGQSYITAGAQSVTASTTCTVSAYYKKQSGFAYMQVNTGGDTAEASAIAFNTATGELGSFFDLLGGGLVNKSASIEDDGLSYRLLVTCDSPAGTATITPYLGPADDLVSSDLHSAIGVIAKINHFQIEETSFATPLIETSGGTDNRATCLIRYPYSTDVFNQTEGTLVFKWTPVTTVYTTNEGLVSIEDGIFNIAYAHTAGGGSNVRSYDATTTCTPASAIVWDGLDAIYVAIRWESTTSKFQIGYRNITDAGSWVWATESAYDGAFASDSWLNLFYANDYPHQMNDLRIYSSDKGTAWVEANF